MPPKAEKGVLDARNWNFAKNGNLKLEGEWAVVGNGDKSPTLYYLVPSHWDRITQNGIQQSQEFYATLTLKILLPNTHNKSYSIFPGIVRNAYELYQSEDLVFASGKPGTSRKSEIPSLHVQSFPIKTDNSGELLLKLKFSCFHYHSCGVVSQFTFGESEEITNSYASALARDVGTIAALGTLGFFHILLFLFWKGDRFHLYFSLICFLAAIRTFSIGELRLIYHFVPEGTYPEIVKWNGFTFSFLVLSFVLYAKEIFPSKSWNWVYLLNSFIAIGLLPTLFLDILIYSKILSYFLILTCFGLFFVFLPILSHIRKHRTKGGFVFLFSIFITLTLYFLDIVLEFGKRGGAFQVQYGLLFFGFSQAIFISNRLIDNFKQSEFLKREKETAEAKANFKSDFLSTMSHEIRTPMNGILGMTQLLKQTNPNSDQIEYIKLIEFSGQNLLNLINDILDLSKLESGMFQLHPEAVRIKPFMKDCLKVFQNQADQKGLVLQPEFLTPIPEYIIIDARRFNQIISNLVSNAIKFTEKGSIHIQTSMSTKEEGEYLLTIKVQDTGIGIPQNRLKDLFLPFVQLHTQTTEKNPGTGLGLTITKKLVEQMKGNLSATSEFGVGSTFSFTIPVSNGEVKQNRGIKPSIEPSPFFEKQSITLGEEFPLSVLVVEDDLVNQKVVFLMMKKLGYTIELANSGSAALTMVESKSYDLIFMDIQMPEMNGLETTTRIRNLPLPKQPIIIALTANVMEEDKEKCLAVGMDDFMTKPLLSPDLKQILRKWGPKAPNIQP